MDQGVLINLLCAAIATLSGAIAFMYRQDSKFKTDIIWRLLDAQEKQVGLQEEQTAISRGVVSRTLGPERGRR